MARHPSEQSNVIPALFYKDPAAALVQIRSQAILSSPQDYDMTVSRLSVILFLVLVAIGYALLTFKIVLDRSLSWLLGGAIIATLVVLYVAQFLNLAFVGDLLAFGDLDEFEDFIHLIVQLLERVGDEGRMLDCLGDGRGRGWTEIGGLDPLLLPGRLGRAFPRVFAGIITGDITRPGPGLDRFRLGRRRRNRRHRLPK